MANENDIGGKVGLDITDFKAGITALNREIKVIDSGFKAAAAGLGEWGESAEGLQNRIDALNKITELQKKKVEALTNEYKRVSQEKGENSKAAQDLQIRINKETESLNKNEKELSDVNGKLNNFGKETEQASDKTRKFSVNLSGLAKGLGGIAAGIGKAAATGIIAVGTAAIAASAGIFKMTTSAGEAADELITLSNQTGLSVKQLQEFQYASRFVDVEVETMTKSMSKLVKSMDSAKGGNKEMNAAFDALKIKATDANGTLRDSKVVFFEAVDALGKVKNETERDALAMTLFGKSAQELNPLIKAGSAELNKLAEEASELGLVLGDEQVAALGDFDDEMQKMKASAKGLGSTIAIAALPIIKDFVKQIQSITVAISKAIKTGDFATLGQTLGNGLSELVNKLAQGISNFAPMAAQILGSLANSIVQAIPIVLPVLIQSALSLLNILIATLTENGPMLISAGINGIMMIVNGIVEALPMLIDAAINIIMTLVDGIIENLPKLIDAAINIVMTLVDKLIENLPKLIEAAVQIMFTLVDGILKLLPELMPAAIQAIVVLAKGLIDALPKLIEKLPQIVETIVDVIVDNLPLLIDAAIEIIVALTVAIVQNLPLLAESALKIVKSLAEGIIRSLAELYSVVPKLFTKLREKFAEIDWAQLGIDIVNGIIAGVKSMAGSLLDSVVDVADGALTGVKNFFGIHSPSRVMRDQVGKMIGAGMAVGITDSSKAVNSAMNGLNKKLITNEEFKTTSKTAHPSDNNINAINNNAISSSEMTINIPLSMDGQIVTKATSRIQFQNNLGKSRALGVVLP